MKMAASNVRTLRRDKGYRFKDRDPAMEELCDLIHKSGFTVARIVAEVNKATAGAYNISPSTINNWLSGKTRRPQNLTMSWVGFAIGYERRWAAR